MSAKIDKDGILDDFALESSLGPETLQSYIKKFPSLAVELTDLYHELLLVDLSVADVMPLETKSVEERSQFSATLIADALSGRNLRSVARNLGLPRDFIAGFRDRKIRAGSIPGTLVANLARAAKISIHQLIIHLQDTSRPNPRMAFKADAKPQGSDAVDFDDFVAGLGLDESELDALNKLSASDGSD
ncbi:MAG: hypothetical protein COA68_16830 [Oceanobacter sp.]|nr:MAG: hypothetical protein COA68_16830 [Oceanobacter sp.]